MESKSRFTATSLVLAFCIVLARDLRPGRDGRGRPRGESYLKLQAGAVTWGGETNWSDGTGAIS